MCGPARHTITPPGLTHQLHSSSDQFPAQVSLVTVIAEAQVVHVQVVFDAAVTAQNTDFNMENTQLDCYYQGEDMLDCSPKVGGNMLPK